MCVFCFNKDDIIIIDHWESTHLKVCPDDSHCAQLPNILNLELAGFAKCWNVSCKGEESQELLMWSQLPVPALCCVEASWAYSVRYCLARTAKSLLHFWFQQLEVALSWDLHMPGLGIYGALCISEQALEERAEGRKDLFSSLFQRFLSAHWLLCFWTSGGSRAPCLEHVENRAVSSLE